jgi:hypothetical protein
MNGLGVSFNKKELRISKLIKFKPGESIKVQPVYIVKSQNNSRKGIY